MTILDIQTAKEISELLEEGKSLDDIRKLVSHHGGTINAWIAESLFSNNLDDALLTLRTAIIERVLKDRIILSMLKAAEHPSEKITRKHVILSELSKSDKALLEREGCERFIEQAKDTLILKVEETIETIPPQTNLFKEILKIFSDSEVEVIQKLMPFSPTHPDLPEV